MEDVRHLPVASLVFIRLSPSVPPGWLSMVTLMSGLAAWNPATRASPIAMESGVFWVRKVISVAAPPSPPDSPPIPDRCAARQPKCQGREAMLDARTRLRRTGTTLTSMYRATAAADLTARRCRRLKRFSASD